eukprot:223394-Rhodomonas_salina.3
MCGAEIACMLLPGGRYLRLSPVAAPELVLGSAIAYARYAMSGTDLAHATTRYRRIAYAARSLYAYTLVQRMTYGATRPYAVCGTGLLRRAVSAYARATSD